MPGLDAALSTIINSVKGFFSTDRNNDPIQYAVVPLIFTVGIDKSALEARLSYISEYFTTAYIHSHHSEKGIFHIVMKIGCLHNDKYREDWEYLRNLIQERLIMFYGQMLHLNNALLRILYMWIR